MTCIVVANVGEEARRVVQESSHLRLSNSQFLAQMTPITMALVMQRNDPVEDRNRFW